MCFNEAAARCRGKRASTADLSAGLYASMRPRPDAAENAGSPAPRRPARWCFNEAAARCRGKPYVDSDVARPARGRLQ